MSGERLPEWDELSVKVRSTILTWVFIAFWSGLVLGAILEAVMPW